MSRYLLSEVGSCAKKGVNNSRMDRVPGILLSCDLQLKPNCAILRNRNQSVVLETGSYAHRLKECHAKTKQKSDERLLSRNYFLPRAEQLSTVTVF